MGGCWFWFWSWFWEGVARPSFTINSRDVNGFRVWWCQIAAGMGLSGGPKTPIDFSLLSRTSPRARMNEVPG